MDSRKKQIILNDEYKGLQIRVVETGNTFPNVVILDNGWARNEFRAKLGDALNEAKKYIDTIH